MSVPPPLLSVSSEAGVTVARLRHPEVADEVTVARLRDELSALVAARTPPDLLIDFADVTFFSSAGVGGILRVSQLCRRDGGRLLICGLSRNVSGVFLPLCTATVQSRATYNGPLFAVDRAAGLARLAATRSAQSS